MSNNIRNSILGFVIGDSLGVPVEFKVRQQLVKNPLIDMVGYGTHNMPEGTWSDDTSMVLATIDSIIQKQKIDYNDIMSKFCAWYLRSEYTATGITFDIGNATKKALNNYYDGIPALKCGGKAIYDNGNGSLMRMLPIILYSYYIGLSEEEEISLLNNCSSLTHAHEISKLGCKIYSDFIKELLKGNTKEDAFNKLLTKDYNRYYTNDSVRKYERLLDSNFVNLESDEIKSTGYIIDTLEACIWCNLNSDSYEEAVLKGINLGNDTDTIGALAGSIAGILYESSNIPQRWVDKIKNKDYLEKLICKYKDFFQYDYDRQNENLNL